MSPVPEVGHSSQLFLVFKTLARRNSALEDVSIFDELPGLRPGLPEQVGERKMLLEMEVGKVSKNESVTPMKPENYRPVLQGFHQDQAWSCKTKTKLGGRPNEVVEFF